MVGLKSSPGSQNGTGLLQTVIAMKVLDGLDTPWKTNMVHLKSTQLKRQENHLPTFIIVFHVNFQECIGSWVGWIRWTLFFIVKSVSLLAQDT